MGRTVWGRSRAKRLPPFWVSKAQTEAVNR